ncbi:MAG: translocation/assembly module TamB domain-containing protein [Methylobacter sp.]|jgi:translocation and assembly module TamB
MKKRILLISLILVLMIPVGLIGLMNSTIGSRWLLQSIFSSLPTKASVKTIDGRLLERIVLSDLYYQSDKGTVAIKKLVLIWQPSRLFSDTLKIVDITLEEVTVSLAETSSPAAESSFDLTAELRLPVQIVIENLLVTNLSFQQGEQIQQLDKLQLSAFTEHGRINLVSLAINAQTVAATAKGQMDLGKGHPLSLTADWQAKTEGYGLWQAITTVTGDMKQLFFDNQLSTPLKLTLKGNLDNLQDEPHITARGDWQNLNWPLSGGKPQVASEQGSIELTGLLSDYQVRLNGDLTRPTLPKAQLAFNGKGNMDALSIENLELKSTAGVFLISGDVAWKDATVFDLKATGQDFNPAILLPELPGSLTFDTRLKGQLAGERLQLAADINKLSGKLRGYPVSASGKLALADEQVKVDALKIVSGANKIAVNGTLGQKQAALVVAIDAPALETLWPGLGGSLKADGQLQGAWKNPSVKFQASGKRLRFAEHSAKQLAIDIDYSADAKKISKLRLSASAIKTGTTQIAKLLIDGSGTFEQHRLNADLSSSYGDVSSALTGHLKAGVWQGDFSRLDMNTPDFGRWQLKDNVAVRVAQSPAGMDVTLAEACLVQQTAAFCMQGRYPANGDFKFQVKARELPAGLMQAYLPEQMTIKGLINADADIQQQKGLLNGTYRLNMPYADITLKSREAITEIPLGASSLSGNINGTIISANLDLALAARDYLRARLQLDTGKTQALSGQVTASVVEFALLNPFVPQLSNMKGNLNADLAVTGSTDKPVVNGAIRFTRGSVDLPEYGLGIREITLLALASADPARPIQLSGSAKSGQGSIRLNGFTDLQGTAELMLNGADFEVAKLPEAQIAVSPELKLVFADRKGKVTGKLKIPKALMQLKEIPEKAVKVSPDEVILGEEKDEQKAAAAVNIDAAIDVELGKQVSFSGQGLKTDLSGNVRLIKTGEKTAMYGNIDMNKAHYKSYGQDLTVRKGRFLFNGPVDKPWLDVEAIRISKSKQVTAILHLTGPLEAPQTRLSSEPALPEAEVLAYLVTGGPLNQVSKSESSMVAGAALSYGVGQVSWIADKLGVDKFEVQEGKTLQDTLIAVGQYLTPDFYVGTKVGLFNKQTVLVLKHKLTNTFNVETQTGTSQRIKLNYEFDTD